MIARIKTLKRKISFPAVRTVVALLAATLALYLWPVNYLRIVTADSEQRTVLASPAAGGDSFVTGYIHSLQLSPVIDEYRIVGGALWSWEERVQSHNAGLPFEAPEHGSFVVAPPWMIVRGGRRRFDSIIHRVGDRQFGQNTWRLAPLDEIAIYELYPGKRMSIGVSIEALGQARLIRP